MSPISPNTLGNTAKFVQLHQDSRNQVQRSLERLTTGKRINRPSDDPAGFIAAEGLRGDILVLEAESRAAATDRFTVRQRDSALGQVQSTLNGVRGNLVSAADGLNSDSQLEALQLEIDASLDAIDLIAEQTEGVNDSSALRELRRSGDANVVDGDVVAAQQLVDGQIQAVNLERAQNAADERVEDVFEELRQDQIVIASQTLSQIEDTDFVEETSNFVAGQILSEASLIALAYSQREQAELVGELLDSIVED
ncbi:MAG: flagellin [Planctomycetota bacterium]